jgi:hypothetical protein
MHRYAAELQEKHAVLEACCAAIRETNTELAASVTRAQQEVHVAKEQVANMAQWVGGWVCMVALIFACLDIVDYKTVGPGV